MKENEIQVSLVPLILLSLFMVGKKWLINVFAMNLILFPLCLKILEGRCLTTFFPWQKNQIVDYQFHCFPSNFQDSFLLITHLLSYSCCDWLHFLWTKCSSVFFWHPLKYAFNNKTCKIGGCKKKKKKESKNISVKEKGLCWKPCSGNYYNIARVNYCSTICLGIVCNQICGFKCTISLNEKSCVVSCP